MVWPRTTPTPVLGCRVRPIRKRTPRVLFLEATNSVRSHMAEAILRAHAGDIIDACSAGLAPGEINPLTSSTLREIGIDPGGLRPKSVREFLARVPVQWAILLSGTNELNAPRCYPFAGVTLRWPCPDPLRVGGSERETIAAFRTVRDDLVHRITTWLHEVESQTAA
jgi:arsenate reductase (thioredoxin)